MPRYWGSWTATSSTGARYRLGMDWSRSGTRVTVDQYLFESAFSIHKDITLTRTGRLSGTYSVGVSTSGGVVSLGRGGSVTGSRGGSVTIGGRATNVLHGLVPSFSHTISIPAVAPSAPGRPSVSNVTSGGWRTAWSAPSNNGGASITQYQVQIRDSSGTVVQTSTTSSRSHTNSGRLANTSYTVRVRARNSAGWGSWSSTRSVTTSTLSPNTPTGVSWSRHSDDAHTVSWSQNVTNARPVDRFRVQRRVHSASGWSNWVNRASVGSGTRSYRDTTRNNRVYQWRVRAENGAGNATSSATGSAWTTPWPPQDVRAHVRTDGGIRIEWDNLVAYGSHDQELQTRTDSGPWEHLGYPSGTVWNRGPGVVDPGSTHQYRIRTRTTSGPQHTSSWSVSNTVQPASPPAAPRIVAPSGVQDAAGQVVIRYVYAPTDGSEQQSRLIRWRFPGGQWTELVRNYTDSTTYVVGEGDSEIPWDGVPGTVEVQVRTWGAHPDPSPWSSTHLIRMANRPTVAINTPVDGEEVETNSVLVTWGYADEDDGEQVAWRLTVLRGSNVVTEESGSGDRDEFLVRGLSDDATYTIRVEVRSGEGLWSAEPDEVTISVSYLPPAPPQIGVAFDRDLGAAVVDVQVAAPHEPYEYVNVVTNPRGRPADTDAEADPLAARQALLDALAAYTDAPVTWSATAPGDTSVVWVDPATGEARRWSAGVGGSVDDVVTRNLVTNPRGRTTDGTVVVVEGYEGSESPDPDLELVDGDLVAPAPVGWAVGGGGVVYYSASRDMIALRVTGEVQTVGTYTDDVPPEGTATAVAVVEGTPGDEVIVFAGFLPSGETVTLTDTVQEVRATGNSIEWQSGFALAGNPEVGATVYFRMLATSGEYEGPYFDGDTPERRADNIIYRYAWDDEPHASPATETALGQGWYDIVDPAVVAAGQEYADAVTALAPVGWDGTGLWWSVEYDAVYVPQGTEATVPTEGLPSTVTLVLLDAETGETTQYWDRTDATIPADTVGRYLRAAIVEGAQFTGPYFDGDHPRGPGQDGSLATYTWDGEPHDSPTTATITSLETESVQLWRAIDDGPWLLIADGVPPDTAISDPIPAIGDRRVNHYRATSVSGIGSAMHSTEHELVVPTHGPGGNHGWVYLNGGSDFSDVVKVRANATRSGSQGLAKTVRRYAGNPRPQQVSGTAMSRTWSIGVNARETLYEEGMSRPEEIEALQVNGGVICYRDPLGARWFASMGMTDDSYRAITGEVSWSMEEVDQPEGLARESRDQSGDDDDDGGEPA